MSFTKLTEDVENVSKLDDKPTLTASDLKAVFDKGCKDIKIAINNLIDELHSKTASSSLGANDIEGNLTNIQELFTDLFTNKITKNADVISSTKCKITYDSKGLVTNGEDLTLDDLPTTVLDDSKIISEITPESRENRLPNEKAINNLIINAGAGDMVKAVYDTNDSGVVDNSEKLNGYNDEYFAKTNEIISKNILSDFTPTNDLHPVNKKYVDTRIPKGIIAMWSGSTIPTGWALCNGSNGTPDLRDRFIVGSGTTYSIGAIGGSVTKDISHTHHYSGTTGSSSGNQYAENSGVINFATERHTHSFYGNTEIGGSTELNILPPYYALAFIMKL